MKVNRTGEELGSLYFDWIKWKCDKMRFSLTLEIMMMIDNVPFISVSTLLLPIFHYHQNHLMNSWLVNLINRIHYMICIFLLTFSFSFSFSFLSFSFSLTYLYGFTSPYTVLTFSFSLIFHCRHEINPIHHKLETIQNFLSSSFLLLSQL